MPSYAGLALLPVIPGFSSYLTNELIYELSRGCGICGVGGGGGKRSDYAEAKLRAASCGAT